jgi:hypothetical protein
MTASPRTKSMLYKGNGFLGSDGYAVLEDE